MKAFDPREWKLSKDQKAKLLSYHADGYVTTGNSLAYRRLCDMGFIAYQDEKTVITDRGYLMVAHLTR